MELVYELRLGFRRDLCDPDCPVVPCGVVRGPRYGTLRVEWTAPPLAGLAPDDVRTLVEAPDRITALLAAGGLQALYRGLRGPLHVTHITARGPDGARVTQDKGHRIRGFLDFDGDPPGRHPTGPYLVFPRGARRRRPAAT